MSGPVVVYVILVGLGGASATACRMGRDSYEELSETVLQLPGLGLRERDVLSLLSRQVVRNLHVKWHCLGVRRLHGNCPLW